MGYPFPRVVLLLNLQLLVVTLWFHWLLAIAGQIQKIAVIMIVMMMMVKHAFL